MGRLGAARLMLDFTPHEARWFPNGLPELGDETEPHTRAMKGAA